MAMSKILICANKETLRVLRLAEVSNFAHMAEDLSRVLIETTLKCLDLVELDISNNNLGDNAMQNILPELEKMSSLANLSISSNRLTDLTIVALEKSNLKSLKELDVSDNQFDKNNLL